MQNKTFRLFISSTFSDFTLERELLQKEIFPEIETYCEQKGFQFQAIDLRWGVNEEAQLDQKTLEVCLEEVKACKFYPHPNFLIMVGNRYGWIPIPYAIEQIEFEKILEYTGVHNENIQIEYLEYKDNNEMETFISNTTTLELLKQWYKLDENQIPKSYILQERTKKYILYENWENEENYLRNILQEAVKVLMFSEKEEYKYFTSATEHEVVEGIFDYLDLSNNQKNLLKKDSSKYLIDTQYIYSFTREINGDNDYKDSIFLDNNQSKVTQFRNRVVDTLQAENNLNVSTTLLTKNSLDQKYLTLFKKFTLDKLKKSIKNQILFVESLDKKNIEIDEQLNFLESKIKTFIGRKNDKDFLHSYINNTVNKPLIVYGISGLGKSSLIAQFLNELNNDFKKSVIYRFVGATPQSSDTKSLLISLLNQLNKPINTELSIDEISSKFYEYIVSYDKKLIIVIDAVDQFYNKDNFTWLPIKLPTNIKIIITALKDKNYTEDSKYFEILSSFHDNLYALEPLEVDCKSIFELLLCNNRTVNKNQLLYVSSKYNLIKSPLYLKIAMEEIKYWKSTDIVDVDVSIESTQKAIIKEFIINLSDIYNHKSKLIMKVMSYIYISNEGLTEKELIDFLSMDEKFLNEVAPQDFHTNHTKKIPISIWARLQFQLKAFISIKNVDGVMLMQFFHREFNDAIKELFDIRLLHLELINYAYEKIISDKYDFKSNRLGKLYTNLVISFSVKYEEEGFIDNFFNKLTVLNTKWMVQFLKYTHKVINEYYQNGLIVEAKIIGLAIYTNKKLFKNVLDKYNFLFILGELEQSQGLTKNAIHFYEESINYTNKSIDKAYSKTQIAKTLRHCGKISEASKLLNLLLTETFIEDSIGRSDAMIQLGLCKFAEKKYKDALNYYTLADEYIVNHSNDRKLKLYNWLGISTVVAFMGDVQKGLELLIKIKNESQQFGYQNFYIDSLNGIAKKYLIFKKYLEAEKYALDALGLAIKQDNKRLCYLMHGYLVESYSGQYEEELSDKKDIVKKAKYHLEIIRAYKEKKFVTETLLNELVDESIMKWDCIYKDLDS